MALSKPLEKAFDAIDGSLAMKLPPHITAKYSGFMSAQDRAIRDARVELGKVRALLVQLQERDDG